MKTEETKEALSTLEEVVEVMRGLVDEARVQAHLGMMEAREAAPYLAEVAGASKAAAHDLMKRGRELKAQLTRLKEEHARR